MQSQMQAYRLAMDSARQPQKRKQLHPSSQQQPVGQGAGGEEWFADAPKQWLFNAFQNQGMDKPDLRSQRVGGRYPSFVCSLALRMIGDSVSARGRSAKDAEHAAALEGCRALQKRGMMQRQVSAKQRGKGKKKKKKGGQQQIQGAQAILSHVQAGAEPFVLPFKVCVSQQQQSPSRLQPTAIPHLPGMHTAHARGTAEQARMRVLLHAYCGRRRLPSSTAPTRRRRPCS
jgi:hypothetical protein|eukprot:COSAG01_NODE_2435_length_7701_cov_7.604709_13_plen_230_part_00